MNTLYILCGILCLYLGGEALVRGSAAIGRAFGMSPLVVGLTLVSMGTSSPELAASVAAVLKNAPAVSFGNVIGSNIANLALILGLVAAMRPLKIDRDFLVRDIPILLIVSFWCIWIGWNGKITRFESVLLISALVVYLGLLLKSTGKAPEIPVSSPSDHPKPTSIGLSILVSLVGIGLLVLGAHSLITGSVNLARAIGISERVIGLTMVAFGTSLPELASSVVAVLRKESNLVLGNLIGSNIFNILLILGVTAAVRPIAVADPGLLFDLSVMIGVSLLIALFMISGRRLTRLEGGVLVALYLGYVGFLFY
jgi:cation:H+ antiporter